MAEFSDVVHDRLIHAIVERQAKKYGDRVFLYWKEATFTFNDLNSRANGVAGGFQRLGIKKGDKVAIIMDNCPEYLFLWFGLSKLGAVEVPLNTAHKGGILAYMLNQSDSRVLVIDSRYADRVALVLAETPSIESIVVLDTSGTGMPELSKPVLDWAKMVDNDGQYEPADIAWSDPFIVMFTSGTTGPSKGSLMPQNYALFMGECVCEVTGYGEDDCLYNALPLFHGNAQLLSTMPALMSGARMVLAEKFSAGRFWDDVKRYGCTEFNYIGGILPILNKAAPKPDDAANPLRIMMGAGMPKELFSSFEKRFGVTLLEVYGMSEMGLPLMNTIKERMPGTCGKPRSDYMVKVVDDNNLKLGPNEPGELLIRPIEPYCMLLEYYNMPEKTVEATRDLWFRTGDYLYYDENGYFYFVDRKKDALRRRGENISSYEVEKVINSHPKVLECAAIASKSDLGEDEVMVVVTLRAGEDLKCEDLLAHCEEQMAHFMVPRYVRFMNEMPKTPTLRIQKNILRDQGLTPDTWDREAAGYKLKR